MSRQTFKELLEEHHKKDPTFIYSLLVYKSHFSEGKGGQNVNKHMNGVRLFHPESGQIVSNHDTRYEFRNHKKAVNVMCRMLTCYYKNKIVNHFGEINYRNDEEVRVYNRKRNECKDHRTGNKYRLNKHCTMEPKILNIVIDELQNKEIINDCGV